ncbi:MAG: DUF4212 domain-containing protein [Planctomycetota bacterium]
MTDRKTAARDHWRRVLILTLSLLGVWFLAGPMLSILLAGVLDGVRVGGFPLGFWMAQQGSIVIFVLLILVYAIAMNVLDRKYRQAISPDY